MGDTYMSSKGQVVIPKTVRDAIGLRQGAKLRVDVLEGRILLTPVPRVTPDDLYGCVGGPSLTADLEAEHKAEIDAEFQEPSSPKRSGKKSARGEREGVR